MRLRFLKSTAGSPGQHPCLLGAKAIHPPSGGNKIPPACRVDSLVCPGFVARLRSPRHQNRAAWSDQTGVICRRSMFSESTRHGGEMLLHRKISNPGLAPRCRWHSSPANLDCRVRAAAGGTAQVLQDFQPPIEMPPRGVRRLSPLPRQWLRKPSCRISGLRSAGRCSFSGTQQTARAGSQYAGDGSCEGSMAS